MLVVPGVRTRVEDAGTRRAQSTGGRRAAGEGQTASRKERTARLGRKHSKTRMQCGVGGAWRAWWCSNGAVVVVVVVVRRGRRPGSR